MSTEPGVTARVEDARPNLPTPRARPGLPVQLSSFVGRARALAELKQRFETGRLVTLTGAGGCGKTRLAVRLAESVSAGLADGVFFVDLASSTDPGVALSTIADVLGIPEEPRRHLLDTLADGLAEKRVLLVLDNLEQLTGAATLVASLLTRCPDLRVLATSRSPLHVRGELEYPVEPLALPVAGESIPLDRIERTEAVALFIDRARATRPGFALTEELGDAVVEICRRLDGLPLAIELAAAHVNVLGPQALLARLEQRLPLLSDRLADAPARQRTLRDVIAWSYDLLPEREQRLFARLSIFVGGFGIAEAEAVTADPAGASQRRDLLGDLSRLVDQSILRVALGQEGEPRFAMLETIRDFATDRLDASGERDAMERRHALTYLAIAERAAGELLGGGQRAWLDRLDRESGNLRSALQWAIDRGDLATSSRLGTALWRFWQLRGHLAEGRAWLGRIVTLPDRDGFELERATALEAAAGLAYWQGDFAAAEGLYREALELRRALGDQPGIASALYNLSFIYFLPRTDLPRARSLLDESLATWRDLGDVAGVGKACWALSTVMYAELLDSGGADLAEAIEYNERSQAIFRESGDRFLLAWALHWRGLMAITAGDLRAAHHWFEEGLRLFASAGDVSGLTILLDDFSALAEAEGETARAARLSGAASALQQLSGTDLAAALARLYSRPRREAADLVEERLAAAWRAGNRLTAEQAVVLALGAAPAVTAVPSDAPPGPAGAPSGKRRGDLTPREREVLELLATGRSDGEIAEALFITKKTASTHVANIKDKLAASSRVEMALMASGVARANDQTHEVR